MSKLKEECGVFGIFNNKDAAALTALGLHALQHRGQEGCGIVTYDGKNFFSEKKLFSKISKQRKFNLSYSSEFLSVLDAIRLKISGFCSTFCSV